MKINEELSYMEYQELQADVRRMPNTEHRALEHDPKGDEEIERSNQD